MSYYIPVSVVSLLKELGRSMHHEHIAFRIFQPETFYFHFICLKHHVTETSISTLIEEKSLLNDGAAIALFEIFMEISVPGVFVRFVSCAHTLHAMCCEF